jgi:hypothetical protein
MVLTVGWSGPRAASLMASAPLQLFGRTGQVPQSLQEYENAIHGLGRYGHLAPRLGPSPAQAAKAALGAGWKVVQGSERTKPLRFRAIGPYEQSAAVAYGPARKFKDLLWAGLLGATEPETPGRVVVLITEPPAEPTPKAERDWHRKLARRCGLELKHFQFSDGR